MRQLCLVVALSAACANSGARGGGSASLVPNAETRVRVVYRHYRNENIFILENLAGRDLVEMRSKPLAKGETAIAYIEDDVMAELMREFRRIGFWRHAGARPPNPLKMGATSEITLVDEERRFTSFLRQHGDPARTAETYNDLVNTFLAVWNHFRPFGQVTTGSDAKFGVKQGEERGR